jgi:hypothetical protein
MLTEICKLINTSTHKISRKNDLQNEIFSITKRKQIQQSPDSFLALQIHAISFTGQKSMLVKTKSV